MISAILLAAGQSLRMNGENKLIKEIDGIPLINYSIKNILGSSISEVIVILGHEDKKIKNIIDRNKKINFIYNDDFKSGMASSIKIGISNISKKAEAFFVCMGDMPNVNQNIYNKLIKARYNYNKKLKPQHRKEIVIPTYEGKNGNPILFSKFMKKDIMTIKGDIGAKEIIKLNEKKVLHIPFGGNGVILDFDTQEDFNSL